MAEIGVISDIHGNIEALTTVLQELGSVDTLACCGDIIGYGPRPSECVSVVRETADIVVRGNHDRNVTDIENNRGNEQSYEGLKHAQNQLSNSQLDWLTSLPPVASNGTVRISHSHPRDEDSYAWKRDFTEIATYLRGDEQLFAIGHTHKPSSLNTEKFNGLPDAVVLNPGSVGQPRDGDPRASYAVYDTEENEAELIRVEYDIESTVEQIHEAGLPQSTATRLKRGRNS